jgi:2-dehydropantoate 2-reductase
MIAAVRIAIFGAGGVGGAFGGRLALAGREVCFVARGEHLRALRASGLVLIDAQGERRIESVVASDDPAALGPVDVVLVATKTWQLAEAVAALPPLLGAETFVVPLVNGVEAVGELVAALGPERVVGGLSGTVSFLDGPGRIRSVSARHTVRFGELDGRSSERTARLLRQFDGTGIDADIPADIHLALWEKFLFVVPLGTVGAATRVPIGVYRSLPETRRILEAAMAEVVAVARTRGVALSDEAPSKALKQIDLLPVEATASLHRDIVAGKPSELEAWAGAVVRLGRASGTPTPVFDLLYGLLVPQESAARQ